ncbi:MAG TPA: transcriptional regulator [Rhodospirillaceae bacterium]|nr:transcriptional regulator [Rhodospirillaceae bacterium]HAA92337.1 transcriptional regulator [Rhodospirillaceae bacterium]HAT34334.1 transcriptional regulator [Rhodospirillaceae bacterium]|tara:strand:- start:1437 stop:1814 length:378 start_codon:yes stop_codon:yes gene_type:complete
MTPFGQRIREMRAEKGATLTEMARALEVSPAYLSALEHGKRGKPSIVMLHQICQYFNIIWDDADELQQLARLSQPRVVVDTGGLSPDATELANLLAENIGAFSETEIESLLDYLKLKIQLNRDIE